MIEKAAADDIRVVGTYARQRRLRGLMINLKIKAQRIGDREQPLDNQPTDSEQGVKHFDRQLIR